MPEGRRRHSRIFQAGGEEAVLELKTKENLQEALNRWEHFWEGSLLARPVVLASVRREGAPVRDFRELRRKRYWNVLNGLWDEQARLFEEWLESTAFPGEMIPMASPDFGLYLKARAV